MSDPPDLVEIAGTEFHRLVSHYDENTGVTHYAVFTRDGDDLELRMVTTHAGVAVHWFVNVTANNEPRWPKPPSMSDLMDDVIARRRLTPA